MLFAYRNHAVKLESLGPDEPPEAAIWVDLCKPEPGETALCALLVPEIPSLADMEEIEISARLYRDNVLCAERNGDLVSRSWGIRATGHLEMVAQAGFAVKK